jgi:hypothetical protein
MLPDSQRKWKVLRERRGFAGTPGRGNSGMGPSTVLDLSPYAWDFVALQFRRTIVLRPGVVDA